MEPKKLGYYQVPGVSFWYITQGNGFPETDDQSLYYIWQGGGGIGERRTFTEAKQFLEGAIKYTIEQKLREHKKAIEHLENIQAVMKRLPENWIDTFFTEELKMKGNYAE